MSNGNTTTTVVVEETTPVVVAAVGTPTAAAPTTTPAAASTTYGRNSRSPQPQRPRKNVEPGCEVGAIITGRIEHVNVDKLFVLVKLPGGACGKLAAPHMMSHARTDAERREDRDSQLRGLKVGGMIEVKVLSITAVEDGKWNIPLSVKAITLDAQRDDREQKAAARANAIAGLKVGQLIRGTVINEGVDRTTGRPYGLFVRVATYEVGGREDGVDGLLHGVEQLKAALRPNDFQSGDQVDVLIIKLETKTIPATDGKPAIVKDVIGLSEQAAYVLQGGTGVELTPDAQAAVDAALLDGAQDGVEGSADSGSEPATLEGILADVTAALTPSSSAPASEATSVEVSAAEAAADVTLNGEANDIFGNMQEGFLYEARLIADHGDNGFEVHVQDNKFLPALLPNDRLGEGCQRQSLALNTRIYVRIDEIAVSGEGTDNESLTLTVTRVKSGDFKHAAPNLKPCA